MIANFDTAMIQCVVFDFDGTLVMSNAIKRDGFTAIAERFPDGVSRMDMIMTNPPGDRYAIMDAFAALYDANGADLVAEYAIWCENRILECPERAGAAETLAFLKAKGISIWINSATPQEPLRTIVTKRYDAGTFSGVLGGHGKKVENLQKIMQAENLSPEQILMVGDGFDDRDGATAIGCPFIGLDQGSLAAKDPHADMLTHLTPIGKQLGV